MPEWWKWYTQETFGNTQDNNSNTKETKMNIAKWRQLPNEEFAQLVAESRSISELAKKIGYKVISGGAIESLKKGIEERKLDTSHFLGQGWNKENYKYSSFTQNTVKKNGKTTLTPLIALRGRKCENCGLETWLGQPINLEVHHIDGNRTNNSLDNLQLLCPNCHSYAPTFRYKHKAENVKEEDYVLALKQSKNIHEALTMLGLTPAGANYTRARELIEKYKITHMYS